MNSSERLSASARTSAFVPAVTATFVPTVSGPSFTGAAVDSTTAATTTTVLPSSSSSLSSSGMSAQTIAILCGSLGAALLLIVVVVVVLGPLRRRQKQQRLERNLNLDSTERGDFESNDSAHSDSLLIVADAATTPQNRHASQKELAFSTTPANRNVTWPFAASLGRGSISSSAADTSARNSISDSGILERRITDRSTNSSNGRFNNYGTSIPTTPFSSPNAPTAPTDLVLPREKSLKRELKVDVVEGDVLERLKSQRAVVSDDAPKR